MSTMGDILNQLRQACPTIHVQPARSLNPIPEINDISLPAAYIHPFDAGPVPPNETIQVVTQRAQFRFIVLIVAKNLDPLTGTDSMELVRNLIFDALLGFEPNGLEPIEYVGGGILPEGYTGPVLWWRDVFRTYQYLRSTQP